MDDAVHDAGKHVVYRLHWANKCNPQSAMRRAVFAAADLLLPLWMRDTVCRSYALFLQACEIQEVTKVNVGT